MATIKGQNLRLFIGNVVIAAATQCDVSIRLNVNQRSTKDDTSDFAENSVVNLSWEVRSQGLVTTDPDRNDTASILDRIGQTVRVELATSSGEKNSDMDEMILAGDAIISDVSVNAPNQDDSTYNITLTGKKNMLTDLRLIVTADEHFIRTSDGHLVVAPHEQ